MTTKTATRRTRTTMTAAGAIPFPTPPEPAPPTDTPAPPADPMPASGMVCLLLDDATVKALDAAFPPPDGATIPAPRHVTLNFLGPVAALDRDTVESAIAAALTGAASAESAEDGGEGSAGGTETLEGVFGGLARFMAESDEDGNEGNGALTPIVALFDCPDLDDVQAALEDALEAVGMPEPTHGFAAHTTLFRADLGETDTIAFPAPPAVKATFTEIALVWGDYTDSANVTMFPADGGDTGTPAAEPVETPDGQQAHVIKHTHGPGDPQADEEDMSARGRQLADDPMPSVDTPTAPDPDVPTADAEPAGRPPAVPGPLGRFEALLVTEGEPTDDGRIIKPGALRFRDPPLPLTFTLKDSGHMDARLGGVLTSVTRDGNAIMGEGVYADNQDGFELKAAVDQGLLTWVSIDVGDDTVDIGLDADGSETMVLLDGLLMGACALPFAAQNTTWIRSIPGSEAPLSPPDDSGPGLLPLPALLAAGKVTLRAVDAESPEYAALVTRAVVACAATTGGPVFPPSSVFEDWEMDRPTAMQITDDLRIFAHLAGPGCHIGLPGQCITAGHTSRDFTMFHHGPDDGGGLLTAEGRRIRVGALTLVGGHASLRSSADEAARHYDDTDSVVAFVRAGWDDRNNLPYIAGVIRPGVSEDKIQLVRALGISGDWRLKEDWRTIDGKPTLVGLPVVPVPGLPQVRHAIAAGGQLRAEVVDTALAIQEFEVIGAADLPIAPRETAWDGAAAQANLADMCGGVGSIDPACFSRGFFWRDPDGDPGEVGSYKLPFADRLGGRLQAVFRGVSAVAGRLDQSDIPAADKDRIKGKISAYYARFRKEFDDPSLIPPWESSSAAATEPVVASGLLLDLAKDLYGRQLADEEAALAGVHRQEVARLGAGIRGT